MAAIFCSALVAVLLVALSQGAVLDYTDQEFIATTQEPTFNSERELRRDIFKNYDKLARPVKRYSTAIPLYVSLSPLSITSMSEKDQVIVLESWMVMNWTDEYLRWDPKDYDNITALRVSPSEVWKPDIALYTAASETSFYPTTQMNVLVFNNGMMLWVPPFTIKSRCTLPFPTYVAERTFIECNIRFGSWTYSGKQINIQLGVKKVDLTNFQDFNREWKLVKVVPGRESKKYPCCVEEYPYVDFNITMKRRSYYLNSGN